MSKYLPYVKIHRKDGDLAVFENGKPLYDTFEQAASVGESIRTDMLQVDTNCNPTVFVLEQS